MIANPQSIKRLGHFLTADNISAGTPNGGRAYPALRRTGISGATEDGHIRRSGRAYPALRIRLTTSLPSILEHNRSSIAEK